MRPLPNVGVLPAILLALAGAASASAQADGRIVPIAHAPSVDWAGAAPGGGVLVQSGLQVSHLSWHEGRTEVVSAVTLPARTFIWDLTPGEGGGGVLAVTDRDVLHAAFPAPGKEAAFARVGPAGDLFRGRLTASPLKREFTAPRSGGALDFVVPTFGGLERRRWTRGEKEAAVVARVEDTVVSDQTLGWGLGYRMSARLTVAPFRLIDVDADGARDLLLQRGALLQARLDGRDAVLSWGRAPKSTNSEILRFDHEVEPLFGDFDHDGRADVILVDPGEGTVLGYRGAGRAGRAGGGDPDEVLRLAGWVLWRWVLDVDGDGRDDLVLLVLPRLNLLEQLRVVKQRSLPVELSVRLLREDGRFSDSPVLTERLDLPTVVSLTRNKRATRFRAPLRPFIDAGGRLCLLGPAGDGLALRRREGDEWTTLARWDLEVETGWVERPFEVCVQPIDGDGVPDAMLVLRGRRPGVDEAVVLVTR